MVSDGHLPEEFLPQRSAESEWWYYCGHLTCGARRFAFHFAYFRHDRPGMTLCSFLPARWIGQEVRNAQFSFVDLDRGCLRYAQHRAPALGVRSICERGPGLRLSIGSWSVDANQDGAHEIDVNFRDLTVSLALAPRMPCIQHGIDGKTEKGAGACSAHLSLPRMDVSGQIQLGAERYDVAGRAWSDREYGALHFGADFGGWIWFALPFDDGSVLMAYLLFDQHGQPNGRGTATWVDADGHRVQVAASEVTVAVDESWTSPATHLSYGTAWRLEIESLGLQLRVNAPVAGMEIDARPSACTVYWEGPVRAEGTRHGQEMRADGYVEQVVPQVVSLPGVYDLYSDNLPLEAWVRAEALLPLARRGRVVTVA